MSKKDKIIVSVDFNQLPSDVKALSDVYRLIATAASVNPDKVESYDCRNIDYSRNGEDLLYKKAGEQVSDKVQITMALAMSGMKVDNSLPPNTSVIYRNGIIMDDGRDLLDVIDTTAIDKSLSLFIADDCIKGSASEDYYKRILVLKPAKLKEEFQDKKFQLWLPYTDTNGCNPHASGKAIYAVCLYDGDESTVSWRRDDFLGILHTDNVPEFVYTNGHYEKHMISENLKKAVDNVKTMDTHGEKGRIEHER